MSQRFWPSAMPGVFQGNPVKRWPRSHSLTRQAEREGQDAAGAAGPEQAGEGEAEGREKRQDRRQAETPNGSAQAN